jgi:acyl carrier protein
MTVVLLTVGATPLRQDDLTPGEAAQFAAVPGPVRQRSWLVARRALRRALTACGRPADTSGYPLPSPVVSLSHSAEVAVAAVPGVPSGVAGVGVDVELDRLPDPRIARLFLTASERAWVADRPAELLRLWTVKEALFKADPGNAGTVLIDYALDDPAAVRGGAHRASGPAFRYASASLRRGSLSVALALALHSDSERTDPDSERTDPVRTIDHEQVAQRISDLVAVPVERLTPDVMVSELVPDSFMFIEVAVDLQEEFDVVLTQQDLKTIVTVGDLVAVLQSRQAGAAAS